MSDGSIQEVKKKSVSSIFPNLPKY